MIVFKETCFHGRMFFPSNGFLASSEREPLVTTTVFAISAFLDPGIHAVHERVRHAPGKLRCAANGDTRKAGKSCTHNVARGTRCAPAQDRFVPNSRQAVDLQ